MKRLCTAVVVALCLAPPQAAHTETFEQVLGVERVQGIVKEVTSVVLEQQAPFYKRRLLADEKFLPLASTMAGAVETSLDRLAAEWRLRGLYGVFVTHVISYVAERSREGPVLLDGKALTGYIGHARELGRCGEIPCPNECKPCNKECDRCP
jgi:hypothetical protein